MHTKNGPHKMVGEVQMYRIRVAAAESKLKLLRDEARQAKRRRKEAKRKAQRARKQFKRFKAELSGLQQALAKAEAKLFQAGGRALARKLAKAKPVAKRRVRPAKKKPKVVVRQRPPAAPRAARAARRAARKKPALKKAKMVAEIPAEGGAIDPTASTPPIPETNP